MKNWQEHAKHSEVYAGTGRQEALGGVRIRKWLECLIVEIRI
jgi:hypothetical protein